MNYSYNLRNGDFLSIYQFAHTLPNQEESIEIKLMNSRGGANIIMANPQEALDIAEEIKKRALKIIADRRIFKADGYSDLIMEVTKVAPQALGLAFSRETKSMPIRHEEIPRLIKVLQERIA